MNAFVWLLVAAATSGYTAPVPIAKFKTEASCIAAANSLYEKSAGRKNMAYLNGVCIQVGGE